MPLLPGAGGAGPSLRYLAEDPPILLPFALQGICNADMIGPASDLRAAEPRPGPAPLKVERPLVVLRAGHESGL